MQQPTEPGKILQWVKASECLPADNKPKAARRKDEYGSIRITDGGKIRFAGVTCSSLEVLEEWFPGIEWLKETEDLSAPASPVEEKGDNKAILKWDGGETVPPIESALTEEKREGLPSALWIWIGEWIDKEVPSHKKDAETIVRRQIACEMAIALYYKMRKLTESKPSPAIEDEKSVHPIYKGWDSVKLIGRARARHKELIEKGWDWRSFYSGWLEGRSGMLQEMLTEYDASHPAPALIVGEREEEKHVHVNLPNGATATVSPDHSPELLNALTKMVDLAKAIPDAPAEQAIPEEMATWIRVEASSQYEKKGGYSVNERNAFAEGCNSMYHKMQDTSLIHSLGKQNYDKAVRIKELEEMVKEKQEWINSHI